MFKIVAVGSESGITKEAIAECLDAIGRRLDGAPHYVMVQTNADHDIATIRAMIVERFPEVSIHGGTSCLGAMTGEGMVGGQGRGLALFAIHDPDGAYGSACMPPTESPHADAAKALDAALDDAGQPGELPALIWVTAAPGHEESVIAGLESVVGPDIPIVGGSSADNAIEGRWAQFSHGAQCRQGMVISVLFPSVAVGSAFRSGYSATDRSAVVTRAAGRTVYELDGKPARTVYAAWLDGALSDLPDNECVNILGRSSLHPLGRTIGELGGAKVHRLSHPESVTPEGALTLFTEVAEGDELILMTGSQETLVNRAARVVESAARIAEIDAQDVSGAIVVYCAGCMLAVRERLDDVIAGINDALGAKPMIGAFTFGEQGQVLAGTNCHGNLMISAVVFGR